MATSTSKIVHTIHDEISHRVQRGRGYNDKFGDRLEICCMVMTTHGSRLLMVLREGFLFIGFSVQKEL